MKEWDLVIVGAGPAGYVGAIRASQLGMSVAIIDDKELPGGTCLNEGCIPSKSLLHASNLYEEITKKSGSFGLLFSKASIDFLKMQEFKNSVIHSLGHGVLSLFEKHKILFIKGRAFLKEKGVVQVNEDILKAKRVLLATGSHPIELEELPFDEKKILSSTGALNLHHIPSSMLVVGAGVIGLELASVYRRLGTKVTVLEAFSSVCPFLDKEVSAAMVKSLRSQGLDIFLEAKIKKVDIEESVFLEVDIQGEKQNFEAEVVLVAIGRRAASQGLGLEALGVQIDSKSRVVINDSFQTNVESVFAVGDLVEGPMLAHIASEEAIVAVELMAGMDSRLHYASIPNVIYTHPEVASVGFTEEEVIASYGECLSASVPLRFNSRAKSCSEVEGIVKIVANKRTHRLLGLHIMGAQASEMISVGSLCLRADRTLEDLTEMAYAHPTLSESIKEAALKALGRGLHS